MGSMKFVFFQIGLALSLGVSASWTKRYIDFVGQVTDAGHAGWWMQPAHLSLKSQPINTWAKISHGQKASKQDENDEPARQLEDVVNDTIEQIKQSEDYEQLKDFIDEKFYDKTEPKASALGISATVCTLLIALF